MSVKPATVPTWNTGGANRTTPSGGQQVAGFATGDQVPSGWMNWFFYWAFAWIRYLADGAFSATSGSAVYGESTDTTPLVPGIEGQNNSAAGVGVGGSSTGSNGIGMLGQGFIGGLFGSSGAAGVAVQAINSSTGLGVVGTSTGTSAAQFSSGANTDQATLEVVGGVKLSTGSVASNTAVNKALMQQNTPKVWGLISCNSGVLSVLQGFNIASVSLAGTDIDVVLASPLAGTNDGCAIATIGSNSASISLEARLTTAAGTSKIRIVGYKAAGGTNVDFSAAGNYVINVVGFGVQ